MKPKTFFYSLLIITLILTSCNINNSTPSKTPVPSEPVVLGITRSPLIKSSARPISTETQYTSPTAIPTNIAPTYTQIPTSLATLDPQQANGVVGKLLRESVDCSAPCFWGITPGQTTFNEANNIFSHLGLQMKYTNEHDNKKYSEVMYSLVSGLTISPLLAIQGDIVMNLDVYINPVKDQGGSPREWLAYSPEILINRYGTPSKITFYVGYPRDPGGDPEAWYHMVMYFEPLNFIIEYEFGVIPPPASSLYICPLTDQFTSIRLWLGKDVENTPIGGVLLEEATSMTNVEFAKLISEYPSDACLTLKGDLFP